MLPSHPQSEADYWLLSDARVSITDMWMTDGILFLLVALSDFVYC